MLLFSPLVPSQSEADGSQAGKDGEHDGKREYAEDDGNHSRAK